MRYDPYRRPKSNAWIPIVAVVALVAVVVVVVITLSSRERRPDWEDLPPQSPKPKPSLPQPATKHSTPDPETKILLIEQTIAQMEQQRAVYDKDFEDNMEHMEFFMLRGMTTEGESAKKATLEAGRKAKETQDRINELKAQLKALRCQKGD